jgi:hypothetical protein
VSYLMFLIPPAIYAAAFLGILSALGLRRRLLIRHRLIKLLSPSPSAVALTPRATTS